MKQKSEIQAQYHPILLFDGVCNLCNGTVQWIIRHDPIGIIHFVPLQSESAQKLLKASGWEGDPLQSVVLLDGKEIFTKSEAIRQVLRKIMPRSPLQLIFYLGPSFLKDWIYSLVARNRYRIFGQKETCMIPGPDIQNRFIEITGNL